jgi:hypothetical protein
MKTSQYLSETKRIRAEYEERRRIAVENTQRWRKENPEKYKDWCRRYYAKNKEKCNASSKAWLEKNREYYNKYRAKYMKRWRKKNKKKYLAYMREYMKDYNNGIRRTHAKSTRTEPGVSRT